MSKHSHLVKMRIANFGCVGPEGLEIDLNNIIALVGPNNTGKTTVLRAYEAAFGNQRLAKEYFCVNSNGQPTAVEIWAHIPEGIPNIAEKWKEIHNEDRIVRCKWEWTQPLDPPVRKTWDPELQDYSEDETAAGINTVFSSRLPEPLRIEALAGPETEHKTFLKVILDPIEKELIKLVQDDKSELSIAILSVKEKAKKPVDLFAKTIKDIKGKVNATYRRTFPNSQIHLEVGLSDIDIKPSELLNSGSQLEIIEQGGNQIGWHQQGTGSQRALFWSMLEVRSELKKAIDQKQQRAKETAQLDKEIKKKKQEQKRVKKAETKARKKIEIQQWEARKESLTNRKAGDIEPFAAPGYMLLIDEPELALHPNAIRSAKDYLYELANEAGWQVMLSTHSPAFIDPLKSHTTIVRLTREGNMLTPKSYRSDKVTFSVDGKENLKMLLQFDNSLAEAFFGSYPIIIEGDTEYVAFHKVMEIYQTDYPVEKQPVLIRARGKYTIVLIARIFTHFKIPFSVLHDSDAPITKKGGKSSAWTANERIMTSLNEARRSGLRVVHRVSIPDFERSHDLKEVEKEKPFNFRKQINDVASIQASVKKVLDELVSETTTECLFENSNDVLVEAVKYWAKEKAPEDTRFVFDDNE